LLYRAHSKLFSPRVALVSVVLFIILVAMPSVNGMESALLVLLLLALFGYGLHISRARLSRYCALWFGAIAGFVVLARLDMAFIPLALLGCCWHYIRDRNTRAMAMAAIVFAVIGCCVVVFPYLLFNYTRFGSVMPISGALKSSFPSLAFTPGTLGAIGIRHYACAMLAIGWLIWRSVRSGSPLPIAGDDYYTVSTTVFAWAVILHFLNTVLFMRWGVFAWYFVPYRLFAVLLVAGWIDWIVKSTMVERSAAVY
jgi:hypothetical protein